MKVFLISLLLLFSFSRDNRPVSYSDEVNKILAQLDETIKQRDQYDQAKNERIIALKSSLVSSTTLSPYEKYYRLFDEFRSFQLDSAFCYAVGMKETAKTEQEFADAQASLIYCYTCMGFFKEANDAVEDVEAKVWSEEPVNLHYFYSSCVGLYLSMSSYYFFQREYSQNYACRAESYRRLMDATPVPPARQTQDFIEHEKAILYSVRAEEFAAQGDHENHIYYKALSVICDIKSATHETTSAKELAQLMFADGHIKRATNYVYQALYDAEFANTKLRTIELNAILHRIEENRNYNLLNRVIVGFAIAFVLLILLVVAIVLFIKLSHRNKALAKIRKELVKINSDIKKANVIRTKNILQTLKRNRYAMFVDMVESSINAAIGKIVKGKTEDAKAILYGLNLKEVRKDSYRIFDEAFLSLYPGFLDSFNKLFPPDEQYKPDKKGYLPMEVRIFALCLLNIDDVNQIAQYLNLSVETVYVYKTKVKSRSIVPRDRFEDEVKRIS